MIFLGLQLLKIIFISGSGKKSLMAAPSTLPKNAVFATALVIVKGRSNDRGVRGESKGKGETEGPEQKVGAEVLASVPVKFQDWLRLQRIIFPRFRLREKIDSSGTLSSGFIPWFSVVWRFTSTSITIFRSSASLKTQTYNLKFFSLIFKSAWKI